MTPSFRPSSFDHVALWVDNRGPLATFLCQHLGMHVIEETDSFTLVGVDAKLGKLTLFDAHGPRERGARADRAARGRPRCRAGGNAGRPDTRRLRSGRVRGPGGLPLGLVEAEGVDYDLDHVVLALADPDAAMAELARLGFERRDGVVAVADRHVRIEAGSGEPGERPLLNHLALLVDDAHRRPGRGRSGGLEIDDVKDAANTFAVFVRGPEGVRIEYVEHKPGFALV